MASDTSGPEPRRSGSGTPSGPVGGALTGTLPNPGLNPAAVAAAIGGTTIDVQTSYPLGGGGIAPLGGSVPSPVTFQAGATAYSDLVWDGASWGERRAGQRVQLALLSDPFFNNCEWYPSQVIALDSANKSYSTGFWDNVAGYCPEADQELLYRFTAKFSQPIPSDLHIAVWRRPYGGAEYDTGIRIDCFSGQSLGQNLFDELTIYAGDEIKFVIDAYVMMQHILICAHRLDKS